MTRRDFISTLASSVVFGGTAHGGIVRSAIGSRGMSVATEEPSGNPYVTDGLIAMWDAEWNIGLGEHDDLTLEWADLAGNGLTMISNGSPVWHDNFIAPTSVDELFHTDVTDIFDESIETGSFSFEVCADMVIGNNQKLLVFGGGTTADGSAIWNSVTNSNMTFCGNVGSTSSYNRGNFPTFGTTAMIASNGGWNVFYMDVNDIRAGWWNRSFTPPLPYASKRFTVGYRFTNPADWPLTTGTKIHSMRVYGRALTTEEFAHNAMLDRARFSA